MSKGTCATFSYVAVLFFAFLLGDLFAQTNPSPIWPMSGHDPQRTGLSQFAGPTVAPSKPSWTFASSGPVIGDLAISAEGVIYFSSDKVYALNSDGTLVGLPVVSIPLTSPAVDDANGFVYVTVRNPQSGYDVVQYSKHLQNPATVFHGEFEFGTIIPTSLIIGPDGTVYFSDGVAVYAIGPHTWRSPGQPFSGPCFGNPGLLTPTLGKDGSVYSMCQPSGGSAFGSGIYRFDGNTGDQIGFATYNRGGTELVIDQQNRIRAGYQAFNGVIFTGSYDAWDINLNQLTTTSLTDFTCTRSALMPDGSSTVRVVGAGSPCFNGLIATGAFNWSSPQLLPIPASAPTVDTAGNVYVGTLSGVAALQEADGSLIWSISLNDTITTQPAIPTGGKLLVGSSSGTIYAFISQPSVGTIDVTTDNVKASFSITGPAAYTGSGLAFTQTNAPAGTYTISYGAIVGFVVPPSQTLTLSPGGAIEFEGTYVSLPAILSISTGRLDFGDQPVGFSSLQQQVVLSNSGGQSVTLSIRISGDFQQSNDCPQNIPVGSSCVISIKYTPTAVGTSIGTLTIFDNAQGAPHNIALSGTGIPAVGRPILFVHGFCGSPEGWSALETDLFRRLNQQYPTLYSDAAVYEVSSDGSSVAWTVEGRRISQKHISPLARLFAIRFSDPRTNSPKEKFDPTRVADIPIAVKGNELAQVLQAIRAITGQADVIVITHSMGGLVSRAYLESLASPPLSCTRAGLEFAPGTTHYASDIAELITLDTPHAGSDASVWVNLGLACFLNDSVNKIEMTPSDLGFGGDFIGTLNYVAGFKYGNATAKPLPPEPEYVSIKSFIITQFSPALFTDGVLSDVEQDMAAALGDPASPKIVTVNNFFPSLPSNHECHFGPLPTLHLLECVGEQQQTFDRIWNVTHRSVFGSFAPPTAQTGGTCKQ